MGEDAPHLAVLAFAQADREPGVLALAAVQPGLDGAVTHALDGHPAGQRGECGRVHRAVHARAVAAQPAGGRQFQPSGERAVVGQQQQPLAVEVEPADADDAGHAGRQAFEHGRAALRVAMRRHQPGRLVVAPQPCALRRVDDGTVDDDDVAGRDERRGMLDDGVVELDAALGQQAFGIAPARDTRAGQPFGDPLAAVLATPGGGFGHGGRAAAMKAAKMRASPGSMWNSGCHCTPRQNVRLGSSIASMTPSGAVALTTACGPASRTAWWCDEFTCISWRPVMRASRLPGRIATLWPGSCRALGCSCARASGRTSGMCWISVPPRATASSCWPPQMPSTGISRASAPRSRASSASVRVALSVTVACRPASPYSAGSTSNAPPVTISASMRSR